jgi:hypothetical protein
MGVGLLVVQSAFIEGLSGFYSVNTLKREREKETETGRRDTTDSLFDV